MRKCGFRDCNNQIKWKEEACEECQYRKEKHVCDACLQSAGYNLLLLGNGALRDFINDTEIMLQRTRKMFAKIPSQFHYLLREMEQSLILTEEEKQAIVKKKCLRILQEIDHEIGQEGFKKILEELEQEINEELPKEEEKDNKNDNKTKSQSKNQKGYGKIILLGIVIFSVIITVLIFVIRKRRKKK